MRIGNIISRLKGKEPAREIASRQTKPLAKDMVGRAIDVMGETLVDPVALRKKLTEICVAAEAEGKNPATDEAVQAKFESALGRSLGDWWVNDILKSAYGGACPDVSYYQKWGTETAKENLGPVWSAFEKTPWRGEKVPEMSQASSSKSKEAEAYREKAEASSYEKSSDAERGMIAPQYEAGPSSLAGVMTLPARASRPRSIVPINPPDYATAVSSSRTPSASELPTAPSHEPVEFPSVPEQPPAYRRDVTEEERKVMREHGL